MKHPLFTLLASISLAYGSAQPSEYTGKQSASTNKEKLSGAAFLNDITPELWRNMALPSYERMDLNRRRIAHYQGYDVYPLGYNYLSPQEHNYNKLIDYLSVDITAVHNGVTVSAQGSNDQLNAGQKQVLATADLNTDIDIRIKFRYKNLESIQPARENKVIEGRISVTVVPETEASFPGGYAGLRNHLTKSVMSKLPSGGAAERIYSDKISRTVVRFTVNEDGKVTEASVSNTSTDPFIDSLIIDALYHLPTWKAAKNAKGNHVKQQFHLALGGDGC